MMCESEKKDSFSVDGIQINLCYSKKEPCMVTDITIGQVIGNIFDFGIIEDLSPDINHDGCQDRGFVPFSPTPIILKKYDLQQKQYYDIALKLKALLHFGKCDKCVPKEKD